MLEIIIVSGIAVIGFGSIGNRIYKDDAKTFGCFHQIFKQEQINWLFTLIKIYIKKNKTCGF